MALQAAVLTEVQPGVSTTLTCCWAIVMQASAGTSLLPVQGPFRSGSSSTISGPFFGGMGTIQWLPCHAGVVRGLLRRNVAQTYCSVMSFLGLPIPAEPICQELNCMPPEFMCWSPNPGVIVGPLRRQLRLTEVLSVGH